MSDDQQRRAARIDIRPLPTAEIRPLPTADIRPQPSAEIRPLLTADIRPQPSADELAAILAALYHYRRHHRAPTIWPTSRWQQAARHEALRSDWPAPRSGGRW